MKCARNSFLPLLPDFPARRVLLISSPLLLSADFHRLWVNGWAEHPEDAVKLLRGTVWFTGSSTHGLSYRSVLSVEREGHECEKTTNVSPGLENEIWGCGSATGRPKSRVKGCEREREREKNKKNSSSSSSNKYTSSDLVRASVHLTEFQIIHPHLPPQRHCLRQTKRFRQEV